MPVQTTFALYFGNRGFFPEKLIEAARDELSSILTNLGFSTITMAENATHYGAVENAAEGRIYADFLEKNRGRYQGVILCLPNFGDENGAAEALRDCGTPIYILAYPDDPGKMDFSQRRDSFCGKLSIMDVLGQFRIPFTAWEPHTLSPGSPQFAVHMQEFAAVCRIVGGLKRCRIGAFGARPTAFKTIRFDETTLQKYGITVEVFDNSDLLLEMEKINPASTELEDKISRLQNYSDFSEVPSAKLETLSKLSLALDHLIEIHQLHALGLRCWFDIEQTLKISPCVVLSELNDRGFPAACELDIGNAIAMYALHLASQEPAACLDWNNNYGDDPDKCILFHCGPVPQSLMTAKGKVVDHPMFAKVLGCGSAFGCNVGRIRATEFSFASTTTLGGTLRYYAGSGEFTDDPIPEDFFGCSGVAKIKDLQQKINRLGYAGYRHHVGVSTGSWERAITEAFTRYLGYEETKLGS